MRFKHRWFEATFLRRKRPQKFYLHLILIYTIIYYVVNRFAFQRNIPPPDHPCAVDHNFVNFCSESINTPTPALFNARRIAPWCRKYHSTVSIWCYSLIIDGKYCSHGVCWSIRGEIFHFYASDRHIHLNTAVTHFSVIPRVLRFEIFTDVFLFFWKYGVILVRCGCSEVERVFREFIWDSSWWDTLILVLMIFMCHACTAQYLNSFEWWNSLCFKALTQMCSEFWPGSLIFEIPVFKMGGKWSRTSIWKKWIFFAVVDANYGCRAIFLPIADNFMGMILFVWKGKTDARTYPSLCSSLFSMTTSYYVWYL